MTNRFATVTHKSDYNDHWQASNPVHLPGLKSYSTLRSSEGAGDKETGFLRLNKLHNSGSNQYNN